MKNYRKINLAEVIRVLLIVTVISAFIVHKYPASFAFCYYYAMKVMIFTPLLVIWLDECQRPSYIAFGRTPDEVFATEEKTLKALFLIQIYLFVLSIIFQFWTQAFSLSSFVDLGFALLVYGANVMLSFLMRRRKVSTMVICFLIACATASAVWIYFPSLESCAAAGGALVVLAFANYYLKKPQVHQKKEG